jgi:hypothetical protein
MYIIIICFTWVEGRKSLDLQSFLQCSFKVTCLQNEINFIVGKAVIKVVLVVVIETGILPSEGVDL